MSRHLTQTLDNPRMPYHNKHCWLTSCGRCGRKHPPERLTGWVREDTGRVWLYIYYQIESVDWREDLLRCPQLEDKHLTSALEEVFYAARKTAADAGMPGVQELDPDRQKLMLACLKRMVANEINRHLWLGRWVDKLRFVFDLSHPTGACQVRAGLWPANFYLDPTAIDVHIPDGCKLKKVEGPPWSLPPDPKSHTAEWYDIQDLRHKYDQKHPHLLSVPYNGMNDFPRFLPPHPDEMVNLPPECTTNEPLDGLLTPLDIVRSLVEHVAHNSQPGLVNGNERSGRTTAPDGSTGNAGFNRAQAQRTSKHKAALNGDSARSTSNKGILEQTSSKTRRKHKKQKSWAATQKIVNDSMHHPAATGSLQSRKRKAKAHPEESPRRSKREARHAISVVSSNGTGNDAVRNSTCPASNFQLTEPSQLRRSSAQTTDRTEQASPAMVKGNESFVERKDTAHTTVSTDPVIDLTQDSSDEEAHGVRASNGSDATVSAIIPAAGDQDERDAHRIQNDDDQSAEDSCNPFNEDEPVAPARTVDTSLTEPRSSATASPPATTRQDSPNDSRSPSGQTPQTSHSPLDASVASITDPSLTADDNDNAGANLLMTLANGSRPSSNTQASSTQQARLYSPHIAEAVALRTNLNPFAPFNQLTAILVGEFRLRRQTFAEYTDLIAPFAPAAAMDKIRTKLDDAHRVSKEYDIELQDLLQLQHDLQHGTFTEDEKETMKPESVRRYIKLQEAAKEALSHLGKMAWGMGFDIHTLTEEGFVIRRDEDGDDEEEDEVPLAMVRA